MYSTWYGEYSSSKPERWNKVVIVLSALLTRPVKVDRLPDNEDVVDSREEMSPSAVSSRVSRLDAPVSRLPIRVVWSVSVEVRDVPESPYRTSSVYTATEAETYSASIPDAVAPTGIIRTTVAVTGGQTPQAVVSRQATSLRVTTVAASAPEVESVKAVVGDPVAERMRG
jgi:hypothetical protein